LGYADDVAQDPNAPQFDDFKLKDYIYLTEQVEVWKEQARRKAYHAFERPLATIRRSEYWDKESFFVEKMALFMAQGDSVEQARQKAQDLWNFLQDWDKPKSKDAYPDEEKCNGQPDTCCEMP